MPDRDDFIDKVVVVGISHFDAGGERRGQQFVGTIDGFRDDQDGEEAMILLCHDGVERSFPWQPDALQSVEPGLYRLNDDGASVRDPDYVIEFAVEGDGHPEGQE